MGAPLGQLGCATACPVSEGYLDWRLNFPSDQLQSCPNFMRRCRRFWEPTRRTCLDSNFKCNTHSPEGIGAAIRQTFNQPDQKGAVDIWRHFADQLRSEPAEACGTDG